MKLLVVTQTCQFDYEDTVPCAVFSDNKKAEEYIAKRRMGTMMLWKEYWMFVPECRCDFFNIEEVEFFS